MSVVDVIARIACDNCGANFRVEIDPACKPPVEWSIWDVVEDVVSWDHEIDGDGLVACSVQDGQMLCTACTERRHGEGEE